MINPCCDPEGTRTPNPQNRNLIFYPLNYGAKRIAKVYPFFIFCKRINRSIFSEILSKQVKSLTLTKYLPMNRLSGFVIILLFSLQLSAQIRFEIDSLPPKTPINDSIYMATSLNGWKPNDINFAFSKGLNNKYFLILESVNTSFEYKICRGSWEKVETKIDGSDTQNRVYRVENGMNVKLSIKGWKDLFPPKPRRSTASKNVAFMSSNIEIPQLNRRRTIRMYFPPNYSTGRRFPVIYMHDGQNLFDDATSFAGEWKVDETLDSLYKYRGFACIVVGIYNGEKHRLNEYSPWRNDSLGIVGEGEEYAKFIVKNLKPFVDTHYRTLPDRDNTAVMGSSMGGLISMFIALQYPEIFGKAAIYSPSFWISAKFFEQIDKFKLKRPQKIYLLAGKLEGQMMISNMKTAEEKLRKVGFDESMLVSRIDSTGAHNESFWGREFGNTLKYLFNFK